MRSNRLGGNNITGVITPMSVVENIPTDYLDPAEVEVHTNVIEQERKKMTCPCCGSQFKVKDEMSKHIDRIHIASALIEGDMRKWL